MDPIDELPSSSSLQDDTNDAELPSIPDDKPEEPREVIFKGNIIS